MAGQFSMYTTTISEPEVGYPGKAAEHQVRLAWARAVTEGWQCCRSEIKREHAYLASPLAYFRERNR